MSLFNRAAALVRSKFENPQETAREALMELSDFDVDVSLSDFDLDHSVFLKGNHTDLSYGTAFEHLAADILEYIASECFEDSGLLISGDAVKPETFFEAASKICAFGAYEVPEQSLDQLLAESIQRLDAAVLSGASHVLFLVTADDLSSETATTLSDMIRNTFSQDIEFCIGAFTEEEEHPYGHFSCLFY